MTTTRLFKTGKSEAVRIPAELACSRMDLEREIERLGDVLRIRPARRRLGDVLGALARFSPDFMREGRWDNDQAERDAR